MKTILIIDSQGGGVGRQLVSEIRESVENVKIVAVGTNSVAAEAMRRAGADRSACGENAVRIACRKADIIIAPIGIIIADALYGEVTPDIARAVGQADALRILIPFNQCGTVVAGVGEYNMGQLITMAVEKCREAVR